MRNRNNSALKGTNMNYRQQQQNRRQTFRKGQVVNWRGDVGIVHENGNAFVQINIGGEIHTVSKKWVTIIRRTRNVQPANYIGDGESGHDLAHDLRHFPCE